MRRVPWVRVAVSVVLGVVLTLGAAWVVPNLGPFGFASEGVTLHVRGSHHASVGRLTWLGGEQASVRYFENDSLPAMFRVTDATDLAGPDDPLVPSWHVHPAEIPDDSAGRTVQSQGLPFRSVFARIDYHWRVKPTSMYGTDRGLWSADQPRLGGWAIGRATWTMPYLVRPVGFAANTGVYGLLSFMALCGPGIVRRRWRRRRGRCERCGYELSGEADRACPECGGLPEKSKPALAPGS